MEFLNKTSTIEKNEYELFVEQLSKQTQAGDISWNNIINVAYYEFLRKYEIIKALSCPLKQQDRVFIIYKYHNYIYSRADIMAYYDLEDTERLYNDRDNWEEVIRCSFVTNNGLEITSFGHVEVPSGDLWRLLDYASQSAFNFNINDLLYG